MDRGLRVMGGLGPGCDRRRGVASPWGRFGWAILVGAGPRRHRSGWMVPGGCSGRVCCGVWWSRGC